MPDPATYLSPREVESSGLAEYDTVIVWILSGQLLAINAARDPHGGKPRWKIARADLDEFLAKRSNRPQVVSPKVPEKRVTPKRESTGKIKFF